MHDSAPTESRLRVENTDDRVLQVRLDRPEQRNALSLALLDELRRTFERHAEDAAVKLGVITGSGTRCFAAGGDVRELDAFRSAADARSMSDAGRRALDAIRRFPVPVYAALNGQALGGGAELALACDFRIGRSNASLGFLQGKLNITTAWGGGPDLVALLGPRRALHLLLSNQVLEAPAALALGLLDAIAADDVPLLDAVRGHAAGLLAKPAHVIRAFTSLARAARQQSRHELESVEREAIVSTWVHEDHWTAASHALARSKA